MRMTTNGTLLKQKLMMTQIEEQLTTEYKKYQIIKTKKINKIFKN